MPPYYSYNELNASAVNDPNAGVWEDTSHWPRTYEYIPAHQAHQVHCQQGLHPPAPIYAGGQQAQHPQSAVFYFAGNANAPAGYYSGGYYYGATAPPPGWQPAPNYTCLPLTTSPPPATHTCLPAQFCAGAQPTAYHPAAAQFCQNHNTMAAATNAVLAAQAGAPQQTTAPAPVYYVPANTPVPVAVPDANATAPTQYVPYKPLNGQQCWAKDLDGSWILTTHEDINAGKLNPGHWEKHPTSGYYFWIKHAA